MTDFNKDYGMSMPIVKVVSANSNAEARTKANRQVKKYKNVRVTSVRLQR